MGAPPDVMAEALEANRVKEALLSQHARTFGRMAAQVLDAVRAGRSVHVLGDGPRAAIAAYVSDVMFRAEVAARALPSSDDAEALLRAVNAFVQVGDVVLVLALEARPGIDRALLRARAKGASCLGLLGEPAGALAAQCDVPLPIPSARPTAVTEALVAGGHVLLGLVSDGLQRGRPRGGSSADAAPLAGAPPAVALPPRPAFAPPVPGRPAPAVAAGPRPGTARMTAAEARERGAAAASAPVPPAPSLPPPVPAPLPAGPAPTPRGGVPAARGDIGGDRLGPPRTIDDSALGFVAVPSGLGSKVSDLGVIDEDPLGSGDDVDEDTTDEAQLLAEAVEGTSAPMTDPRGRPPRLDPAGPPTPRAAPPSPGTRRHARPQDRPSDLSRTPMSGTPALLRFRCGGCEEPIVVEERHAGRRGQCPHCRCEFQIPRPQADMTATQRAQVVGGAGAPPGRADGTRPPPPASGPHAPPAQAKSSERRRASRILVKDALVRFGKQDFPGAGAYHEPHTLEDLSLTGMRFVGRSRDFEVGDVLCFLLDFPAFPEPVRIKGEVRRVVKMRNGGGWGAGIRFVQYQGDAEAKVRRLLDNAHLRAVRRR